MRVQLDHVAPNAGRRERHREATLEKVEGRRLTFNVSGRARPHAAGGSSAPVDGRFLASRIVDHEPWNAATSGPVPHAAGPARESAEVDRRG